jgi:hypothetical protein
MGRTVEHCQAPRNEVHWITIHLELGLVPDWFSTRRGATVGEAIKGLINPDIYDRTGGYRDFVGSGFGNDSDV